MVIKTFKDIKKILNKVPDEILGDLAFGVGENSEDTVRVIAYTDEYFELFDKIDKEYPELNEIFNLIENIREAQKILDEQEDSEFIEDVAEGGLTSEFITGEDELGICKICGSCNFG